MSSRNAQAYPFYIDVQGGLGEYLDTTSLLFSSGTSGSTSFGLSGALGFYYTPIEPRNGFDFQVGIQNLYLTPTQGANYYSTIVPYPSVRLQIWMGYATFGLSPFVFRRSQLGPGFDGFSLAQSTLAYLAEVGVLYPATPKFSMGAGLSTQFFSSKGVLDTQPGLSLHFVMRFYFSIFGIGEDGPASANPLEFQGWRYIGK